MKTILSFFIIYSTISTYFLCAQTNKIQDNYVFVNGILFNREYVQARIFSELEKKNEDKETFILKSWAINITPFDFITLSTGTISNAGVWSRFNNPAPSKTSALKQPYAIQNRLITNLPTKNTSPRPPSVVLHLDFDFIELSGFASEITTDSTSAGTGIRIPFESKSENKVKGSWLLAWKMTNIHPKEDEKWFVQNAYFQPEYFHSVIQEFSMKTPSNTILLSTGFAQMPKGIPAGFFRSEYSLYLNPFLVNIQAFISDYNYLTQNGNFQKDTIMISLNPQLRFNFYGRFIKSFNIGFSPSLELQNSDNFMQPGEWYGFFDFASELKFVFFSMAGTASISEIAIKHDKKPFQLAAQENTLLKVQAKVFFLPWYLNFIKRNWAIQGIYETYPKKEINKGNIIFKIDFLMDFLIKEKVSNEINLYTELDITPNELKSYPKIHCGVNLSSAIVDIVRTNQNLSASAKAELSIKENSIHDIKSEFSLFFEL